MRRHPLLWKLALIQVSFCLLLTWIIWIWGLSTERQTYFLTPEERDYLAEYAGALQFIPIVTREQHPGALNGRITRLIENGELERVAGAALTPEHSRVMICGNPQMIDDTRALLKQRDMQLSLSRRPGQVAVENYW